MASGLTLDTGALIAAEKRARRFAIIWEEHLDRGSLATVPAVVVAQVWRGNSPIVARLLQACEVQVLDEELARKVGELLARARTADVTDAAVVVGAVARGDAIVTSDPEDIGRLIEAAGAQARILRV
jgi:predicted nucleic acid-binding protein